MQVLEARAISIATPSMNFSVYLSYECSGRKRLRARRAAPETDGILASISPRQLRRISYACIRRNWQSVTVSRNSLGKIWPAIAFLTSVIRFPIFMWSNCETISYRSMRMSYRKLEELWATLLLARTYLHSYRILPRVENNRSPTYQCPFCQSLSNLMI